MLNLRIILRVSLLAILSITLAPENIASQLSSQELTVSQPMRLVTDAEHKAFLISTLESSNNNDTLLISSHDISPKIFHNDNIAGSIIAAANRGARIYIYFKKMAQFNNEDHRLLQILERSCVKFEMNCNHSKCVVKNKGLVAIGSYNWLSDFNDTSSNATVVLNGAVCFPLKEDIWQGMRFYQSLAHANGKGVNNFVNDESVFLPKYYNLGDSGQLAVLRTPEAHGFYLNEIFNSARNDIFMFSPFIRLKKLMETFTDEILRHLESRKVKTVLVTLPASYNKTTQEQSQIFAYLDQLQRRFPYFSYQTQRDFHAKTLVSDNMICEGSFNWLSAVGDIGHDANNYEVSVAFKGECALSMLTRLNTSALGQAVLQLWAVSNNMHEANVPEMAPVINNNIDQTPTIPGDFDTHIRIFSGAKFNKQGFCVKLDNIYIADEGKNILYFETEEHAKQIAYQVWLEMHQTTYTETSERSKKRERREAPLVSNSQYKQCKPDFVKEKYIPKSFDAHVKIYSGATFNQQGFCVKLDGKYIVDESNKIMYFNSKQLAKQTAYDVWVSNGNKRSYN